VQLYRCGVTVGCIAAGRGRLGRNINAASWPRTGLAGVGSTGIERVEVGSGIAVYAK
jgi:hypothetical protein